MSHTFVNKNQFNQKQNPSHIQTMVRIVVITGDSKNEVIFLNMKFLIIFQPVKTYRYGIGKGIVIVEIFR